MPCALRALGGECDLDRAAGLAPGRPHLPECPPHARHPGRSRTPGSAPAHAHRTQGRRVQSHEDPLPGSTTFGRNILARRVLGLDQKPVRKPAVLLLVPGPGEPQKLVHRIETAALDLCPATKTIYLRWQDLEAGVAELLAGRHRVAMEYAPRYPIPYVSRVDAGTIELVRACGVEIVSSGDLIQQFEATWDDEQWQMHQDAEKVTDRRVRRGVRADRRASRRPAARFARPRSRRRSWIISIATA